MCVFLVRLISLVSTEAYDAADLEDRYDEEEDDNKIQEGRAHSEGGETNDANDVRLSICTKG